MSESEELRLVQYCLSSVNVGKRVVGSVLIDRDYVLGTPHLRRIFHWCKYMPKGIGGVYCSLSGLSPRDIIRSESESDLELSLRIVINYPKGEEVNGLTLGYEWIPLNKVVRVNSLNDYLVSNQSYFIESGSELMSVMESNRHLRLTSDNRFYLRGNILNKLNSIKALKDGKDKK